MSHIRVALHIGAGPDATQIEITATNPTELDAMLDTIEERLDRIALLHSSAGSFTTSPAGSAAPVPQAAAPAAPVNATVPPVTMPDPIVRAGGQPQPLTTPDTHPKCAHGYRGWVAGAKANGAGYAFWACQAEKGAGQCSHEYPPKG